MYPWVQQAHWEPHNNTCRSLSGWFSILVTQSKQLGMSWCMYVYLLGNNNSSTLTNRISRLTVYPKKYAHAFVVLCFVVVMQSFIMNSHEVFIHIHQSCFAGIGAIVRLPQCQWSKPDGYGKISHCITTTKHSKAKTVCIFLGIYCRRQLPWQRYWQWRLDYNHH